MRFDIISIFPELLKTFKETGLLKKARDKNLLSINIYNPRDCAKPPHFVVDDYPYGGGPGMVMKVEPIVECVEAIEFASDEKKLILITSPLGKIFNQKIAREFINLDRIVIICGRYEGIDERVREIFNAEYISCGEYILMGGEVAAMVIIESVARLIPGVIGNEESLIDESYKENFLEYPQYTRPRTYRGYNVPEVLLTGDHERIKDFREKQKRRYSFDEQT
ncbi:MAG: tRNA (guanosine(37)-N1)-methyltransferase TrmD [Candidatus Hydrogenedentota bacterium]